VVSSIFRIVEVIGVVLGVKPTVKSILRVVSSVAGVGRSVVKSLPSIAGELLLLMSKNDVVVSSVSGVVVSVTSESSDETVVAVSSVVIDAVVRAPDVVEVVEIDESEGVDEDDTGTSVVVDVVVEEDEGWSRTSLSDVMNSSLIMVPFGNFLTMVLLGYIPKMT